MSDATQAMPPTEPPDSGGGADDFDEGDRRKIWMIVAGVLVLGLLVGVLIAVLAGGGDDSNEAADGSSTSSSSTTTTSTPLATTTQATNADDRADPATGHRTADHVLHHPGGEAAVHPERLAVHDGLVEHDEREPDHVVGRRSGHLRHLRTVGLGHGRRGCPPPGQGESHTYTVTAKGPGGQVQRSATVQFFGIPQP